MQRREFLAASGAGALAAGCGGLFVQSPEEALGLAEMDAFVQRLDATMLGIERAPSIAHGMLRPDDPIVHTPEFAEGDAFTRAGMQSLVLTAAFHDLPAKGQGHPAVQGRMLHSMEGLDSTVAVAGARLRDLTPTERADLKVLLREKPRAAMDAMAAIDREAGRLGVSPKRRLHLREMTHHVATRMRHSADLFVDETVARMDRVAARHGSDAEMERRLMALIGKDAFEQSQARLVGFRSDWAGQGAIDKPVPWSIRPAGAPPTRPRPGSGVITAGAWMLGMGVAAGAVGAGLLAVGFFPGVFSLTAAAIGITAGLITLLVGLIIRGSY